MRELVIKAKTDDDAKLEILKSFKPLIKKAIKIYVKDYNHYDDAMQNGYLTILSCIKTYNPKSPYPFEAYLKRAVIFSMRDFSKKIKNDMSLDEDMGDEGANLYEFLESDVDIEGDSIRKENIERVRKALSCLSKKQREIIEQVFFQELSMMDICKNRRCHYMAVVGLKNRAIDRLREELMND